MNRREFLQSAALAAGAGRRPNIVLVQTDSWDGRVLGCLGHPAMRRATPNIDRLASQGTVFRNAYCSHPICCPSRANMWTGRYTQHVESWNNFKGLSPDTPRFQTYLEKAGYRFATKEGGFGKHDYLSGAHTVFNRIVDWTGPANIPLPQFRMPAPVVREDEARPHRDWETVALGKQFLREAVRGGQPFFLYLGLNLPHPPFATQRKWLEMVDRGAVTLPPEDDEVHPVMAYQRISKNWEHGFSPEMVRRTREVYYAMCAETDAMTGEVIAELDRLGVAGNTWFLFTSDHGENNMEHRQYYKMNMYESSVRVPLIVRGPGVTRGRTIDNLVSLVDLFPTLLDIAGVSQPKALDGESLAPLLRGTTSRSRDWAYAMYSGSSSNTTMFMLRKGPWKYVAYPGYRPQLFHEGEDPEEVKNLARKRPEVVKALDADLRRIVDYEAVHRRVIAYDKASFGAWREATKRKPIPFRDNGAALAAATYDQIMPYVYRGWGAEHEAAVGRWLESR
ncbi:MAG: sulfatase-like hydrolase/transferase [Bryobacteraceae bacterium]